jgi:sec-independent protein translocase protein TatC
LLSAEAILKGWRLAVVVSAFVAALATPVADPTSMFVLMIPLLVLYFVALGIAAIRDRTVNRRQRKMLAEYGIQDSGDSN